MKVLREGGSIGILLTVMDAVILKEIMLLNITVPECGFIKMFLDKSGMTQGELKQWMNDVSDKLIPVLKNNEEVKY